MAKVSEYPEELTPSPQGWLFMAVLQGDGSYITHKVAPDNIGAQGPTGPQGLPGADGSGGTRGTVIYSGVAAPGPGDGEDGDFYYQTVGPVFWGPKTAGVWSLGINLKGADGEDSVVTRLSTTSLTIGTGSRTFTYTATTNNIGWAVGQRLRAVSAADPTNFMDGLVTFVDGASVDIEVDATGGSGTFADWTIFITGASGADGAPGAAGATGATGATGASGITTAELILPNGWCIETFDDYSNGAITAPSLGFGWGADGVISGGVIADQSIQNGKTEKRLVLTPTGKYARQFYFGSNWHRIQLAVLWSWSGAASFTQTAAFGLCSGTANTFGGTTDNYIGTYFDPASPTTWTYNAGTLNPFYSQSVSTRWATKRGATITDRTGGVGSDGRRFSATADGSSWMFLEFYRPIYATAGTSVTYTMGMRTTDSTIIEFPTSKRQVYTFLNADTASTAMSSTMLGVLIGGGAITNSFAFDVSTGDFDCINIHSNNGSGNTVSIGAIAVRKIY